MVDDGESSFVLLVIITTVCTRTVVGDPPTSTLTLFAVGLHAIMQMREKRGFISASPAPHTPSLLHSQHLLLIPTFLAHTVLPLP